LDLWEGYDRSECNPIEQLWGSADGVMVSYPTASSTVERMKIFLGSMSSIRSQRRQRELMSQRIGLTPQVGRFITEDLRSVLLFGFFAAGVR